jgi:hypothetical protein
MKTYLAAALLIASTGWTFAQGVAGPWFVGLETATGKCSVVNSMPAGMKMMGKYNTKEEAETAMAGMKECKG